MEKISNIQANVTKVIVAQWERLVGTFSPEEANLLHEQNQKIFSIISVEHMSKNGFRVESRLKSKLQKADKAIDKFLQNIEEDMMEIGQTKARIRAKIQHPHEFPYKFTDTDLLLKFTMRSTKIEILNYKQEYLNEMVALLSLAKQFCMQINKDNFYIKVTLNNDVINSYLSKFDDLPTVIEINKSIKKMKKYLKKLQKSKSVSVSTVENAMFQKALELFDPELNYIKDTGVIESIFYAFLETNPIEETKRSIRQTARLTLADPANSGQTIFNLVELFSKNIENKAKQIKPILFLLLSRVIFSEIYEGHFSLQISQQIRGIGRIGLLRTYPPSYFGINTSFLPPNFADLPIANFPKSNEYETVISILKLLPYQYCPIDFCYYAYTAIARMEEIASTIHISEQVKTTGKISAMSEHHLSSDDLIDLLMILFLYAEPPDIGALMKIYEPFVNGLLLPQEFSFAFVNFKVVCEKIDGLDIDKFVEIAAERDAASYPKDPLGIYNFKSIL